MTPPPPPPTASRRRNLTEWVAGGIAGAVVLAVVIIVGVVLLAGRGGYAYRDDLCDSIDTSPVFDVFPMADADHSGESRGNKGHQVCEFRLQTEGLGVSTLRLTVDVWPNRSQARHQHEESVEFLATSELVPHAPFHTVEEAAGPWQRGMLYVGDVFRSADYNVRLKVQDGNLTLQVDLIIDGADAPTTYRADGDLPVAVQRVAANTLESMAR